MIISRLLHCVGHVIRMPDTQLPRQLVYGEIGGWMSVCWWAKEDIPSQFQVQSYSVTFYLIYWKNLPQTEPAGVPCLAKALPTSERLAQMPETPGITHDTIDN